jgi:hypothetical protein
MMEVHPCAAGSPPSPREDAPDAQLELEARSASVVLDVRKRIAVILPGIRRTVVPYFTLL